MIIKEYRVVLPLTVEEYQVAQLWSVAQASLNETGGGEGVEVVFNEPFDIDGGIHPPKDPLLNKDPRWNRGQYTKKFYRFQSRVPGIVRALAPSGSLEMLEEAWNGFPYCRTIITNPGYMKENFMIKVETLHLGDAGTTENAHNLPPDLLAKREVVIIDIANDKIRSSDYKAEWDPKLFKSQKTGRGPLTEPDWKNKVQPVMTCYKLVSAKFKWRFLPFSVEKIIHDYEHRIFTNFHRQLFCWMDKWHGLTMKDIRELEGQVKEKLDKERTTGQIRGTGLNPDEDSNLQKDGAHGGSSKSKSKEKEEKISSKKAPTTAAAQVKGESSTGTGAKERDASSHSSQSQHSQQSHSSANETAPNATASNATTAGSIDGEDGEFKDC